jgi:hypothetical protein
MDFPLFTSDELKAHLAASGRRGLALDIDETLARTDHQWLDVFFERFGVPPGGRTRDELIAEYQFIERMPFWSKEDQRELAEEFLHSNEFQVKIPLIENAHHRANEIARIVPIVAYVTARPVSVAEGTRTWLRTHGFPEAPLVLRPLETDHYQRNAWKAGVLRSLYPNVLGIVDDNQGLVDELGAEYPGTVFIYAQPSHPMAGARVIPCADWDAVVEAVRRHPDMVK